MKQHIKIQPFLVELVKDRIGKMRDHQECVEMSFMDKVGYHYKYMKNIRSCSENLQKHGLSLYDCQMMLDLLIGKVQGGRGVRGSMFEKCNLNLTYLSPKNGLSTDADFETGIAKIQSRNERTMTQAEKRACLAFRKDANLNLGDESDLTMDSDKEDFFLREFEQAKRQKLKESSGQSDYINCTFITGSAAVVESLWSVYDAFNSKRRRGMSPITVEMILFLKKNKDLWGIEDVARANQSRLKADKSERVERKIAEHEEFMHYLDLQG
jgi:hypothetical protein